MGRKQIRTRKHLLFCFAGLIFLFINGCASLDKIQETDQPAISLAEKERTLRREAALAEEKKKEETARAHLLKGRQLFAQGDFEGSLREYHTIITFFKGQSPMEEAIFSLGLIYVHPGNPNKDFVRSLDFMKRLAKEYSNSFFGQEAKVWISILLVNEKVGKEHEKLMKENEKLIKENEKLIRENEKLIREHEKMSKILEEYKQVDIEIEEKKREKGR
jgi:hypothetical protein